MAQLIKFKVNNLFGYQSFDAPLKDDLTIFVGENGLGKTTLMRILFLVLKKDFIALRDIDFSSIELSFADSSNFIVKKEDIDSYSESLTSRRRPHSSAMLSLQKTIQDVFQSTPEFKQHNWDSTNMQINTDTSDLTTLFYEKVIQKLKNKDIPYVPRRIFIRELKIYLESQENISDSFNDFIGYIDTNFFDTKILYFPTYRRIADDLQQLSLSSETLLADTQKKHLYPNSLNNNIEHLNSEDIELLKFGMEDVDAQIKEVLEEIRKKSLAGFNDLNTKLLDQYTKTDIIEENDINIDETTLDIVLERLGDRIDAHLKNRIKQQLFKDESTEKHTLLKNFVAKLLESYKKTEIIENRLKLFAEVTNDFLFDKKFVFDPSALELPMLLKSNGSTKDEVKLKSLSSGEKQLVSLFARIFLHPSEKLFIIFDEPELSLSIDWQEKLITNMQKSDSLSYLIAITHSPFIFSDESIKNHALYMTDYMKRDI